MLTYINFSKYFPSIARDAVRWEMYGPYELVVELRDGSIVAYNDMDNSLRNLPQNSLDMTSDECKKEFGIRLYNMLKYKSMTQQQLSEATGIQQSLISNYINGSVLPSFFAIDKIAKALNCSTDDFRYKYK